MTEPKTPIFCVWLTSAEWEQITDELTVAIGKDPTEKPDLYDLRETVHMQVCNSQIKYRD